MRTHRTLVIALSAMLVASAAAAANDKVYKWTDAEGVTHYGDAPPAQGEFEARPIPAGHRVATAPAEPSQASDNAASGGAASGSADAMAPADEDPQCAAVRRHLALLRGDAPVQQDTDGDGKADRILTQADREAQARLAEIMLAKDCPAPAE